jgi:diacylglycerol kinase
MVCCTLIAGLLALLIRPVMAWRANPLTWRLDTALREKQSGQRATSRLGSVSHAIEGLVFVIRNEPNMRIHVAAASLTLLAGLWLEIDASEWRWLVLAIALVFSAEVFNTAVEQCCNAISREYDAAIKAAKDTAAAAVLIAAIAAALIGAGVLLPHFRGLFQAPSRLSSPPFCGGR